MENQIDSFLPEGRIFTETHTRSVDKQKWHMTRKRNQYVRSLELSLFLNLISFEKFHATLMVVINVETADQAGLLGEEVLIVLLPIMH